MKNVIPNSDQMAGKLKQAEGKAQDARGDLTGNVDDNVDGKARQVEGAAQETYGNVKKAIHNATR
jgi:uncharacterized protein YjbJ (UPF0337 family)